MAGTYHVEGGFSVLPPPPPGLLQKVVKLSVPMFERRFELISEDLRNMMTRNESIIDSEIRKRLRRKIADDDVHKRNEGLMARWLFSLIDMDMKLSQISAIHVRLCNPVGHGRVAKDSLMMETLKTIGVQK